jgi:SAM-dependent methyltransferase
MRLFGMAMLRNEADIVEAFIRHNLTIIDGMAIVDHGSFDGTTEILARLRGEGLALRVVRDPNPGFFQAERMTVVARDLFAREDVDFVFALDADEFLKVASRAALEQALSDVPAGAHASLHWLTYVPQALDEDRALELRWRLASERHGSYKVVVGRSLAERPRQYLISGNHLVDDAAIEKPPPHVRLAPDVAALAHCPVRSRDQLERKIVLGYLAHLATRPDNDRHAFHWRDLFEELRDGMVLSRERLREIACNYGLPRDAWRPAGTVEVVEDPVHFAFALRYGSVAVPDTLRLLMRFTETLLRQ